MFNLFFEMLKFYMLGLETGLKESKKEEEKERKVVKVTETITPLNKD